MKYNNVNKSIFPYIINQNKGMNKYFKKLMPLCKSVQCLVKIQFRKVSLNAIKDVFNR